jgi:hypothetical protein
MFYKRMNRIMVVFSLLLTALIFGGISMSSEIGLVLDNSVKMIARVDGSGIVVYNVTVQNLTDKPITVNFVHILFDENFDELRRVTHPEPEIILPNEIKTFTKIFEIAPEDTYYSIGGRCYTYFVFADEK